MFSFLILSFLRSPHIYLNICISARCTLAPSHFLVVQQSFHNSNSKVGLAPSQKVAIQSKWHTLMAYLTSLSPSCRPYVNSIHYVQLILSYQNLLHSAAKIYLQFWLTRLLHSNPLNLHCIYSISKLPVLCKPLSPLCQGFDPWEAPPLCVLSGSLPSMCKQYSLLHAQVVPCGSAPFAVKINKKKMKKKKRKGISSTVERCSLSQTKDCEIVIYQSKKQKKRKIFKLLILSSFDSIACLQSSQHGLLLERKHLNLKL